MQNRLTRQFISPLFARMRQQATLSFVSLQPASLPQTIMQRIGRWSDLGLPAIITEIWFRERSAHTFSVPKNVAWTRIAVIQESEISSTMKAWLSMRFQLYHSNFHTEIIIVLVTYSNLYVTWCCWVDTEQRR